MYFDVIVESINNINVIINNNNIMNMIDATFILTAKKKKTKIIYTHRYT